MRSVNLWRWSAVAVLAIAMMVGCAPGWNRAEAALWTEPGGVTREDPDLVRLNQAMIRLAKSLRQAVVQIGVSGERGSEQDLPQDHPPLPPGERPRGGSGLILTAHRFILTKQHPKITK